VAKFGKDPIYRTKVIVRKPVWTPTREPEEIKTQNDHFFPFKLDLFAVFFYLFPLKNSNGWSMTTD
jgi:hypothetical protein